MQINERPICIFCFIKKKDINYYNVTEVLSMQNIELTKIEKGLAVFTVHLIYIKNFL